ncbi:MAG: hypothetical protein U0984_16870, partial [Prosthecobacter sp.]|nr:hypothetical protein [Prosthecobacter sp.]
WFSLILSWVLLAPHSLQAQTTAPSPLVVMLKLDDLVRQGSQPQGTVSPRWQRVTDFLEGEKIKASYGILCDSLEGDCPGYVDWLKQRVAQGWIELWHHGYYRKGLPEDLKVNGRTAEYMGGTVEDQAAMFRKSFALVKEKVGVDVIAFGPHSTAIDGTTYEALEQFPQIKLVWFYGPPKGMATSKYLVKRLMELEKPLFVPNAEAVRQGYEMKKATLPYIAIQGHPNQWDDARFESFQKAVLYLRDQGCRFVTPSEFLASEAGKSSRP